MAEAESDAIVVSPEAPGGGGSSTGAAFGALQGQINSLVKAVRELQAKPVQAHFDGYRGAVDGPTIRPVEDSFTLSHDELNVWHWADAMAAGQINLPEPVENGWTGWSNFGSFDLAFANELGSVIAVVPPGAWFYVHTVPEIGTGFPKWPLNAPVFFTEGTQAELLGLGEELEMAQLQDLLTKIWHEVVMINKVLTEATS